MNLDELKRLAKELPEHHPEQAQSDALRASLLSAVEKETIRPASRPWMPILLATAAAAVIYVGVLQRNTIGRETTAALEPAADIEMWALASLHPSNDASFSHRLDRNGVQEEVRLSQGRLQIDAQAERSLTITTHDAIVQSHAAKFSVSAKDNRLFSVIVQRGEVEVSIQNQTAIILSPGQQWALAQESETIDISPTATPVEAEAVSEPLPVAAPITISVAPRLSKRKPTSPKPRKQEQHVANDTQRDPEPAETIPKTPILTATSAELAFQSGYQLLRRRDYAKAIAEFDAAIRDGEDKAMQGDSRYWRSISLAKLGRKRDAMRAMSDFLQHHAMSFRAAEVATMLGWLYVETGSLERAAALFDQGADAQSPQVKQSAAAGLKAIADSRKSQ